VSGETSPALVTALEDAQRLGFLGSRPIAEVIEHARGFVHALEAQGTIRSVLDLGSGGGVPGLVVAHDLPTAHVTLLDRRAKRTDALERVVRRLGWQDRVSVVCQDADVFGPPASFDAVVARGFGPPAVTLSTAARLVRPGHAIVISEPPGRDRWDADLLARLRLHRWPDTGHARSDGGSTTPSPDPGNRPSGLVVVFVKD
jgi:16S rRNA (guanine527-N7)-methyltransferase